LGSILPSGDGFQYKDFKDDVVVWMNGTPVWWRRSTGPVGPNPNVEIMANFIGSSAQRNSFDGNLRFWTREPAPVWRTGPFKAVEMDIAGRGAGNEPLLATGESGYADTLAISWLPGNRAQLLYDHWGWSLHSSGEFDWDPAKMHHLRIELPSLAALDAPDNKGALAGRLRAEVDGTVVWDSKVPYYPAASKTFSFARNKAGSSVSSESLSLFIGDVRQAP
jgi:hypothetical protein